MQRQYSVSHRRGCPSCSSSETAEVSEDDDALADGQQIAFECGPDRRETFRCRSRNASTGLGIELGSMAGAFPMVLTGFSVDDHTLMRTAHIECSELFRRCAGDRDGTVLSRRDCNNATHSGQLWDLREFDLNFAVLEFGDSGGFRSDRERGIAYAREHQRAQPRQNFAAVWSCCHTAIMEEVRRKVKSSLPLATLAQLLVRNAFKRLFDVLAAAGPGELLADGAHGRTAHGLLLTLVWPQYTPGGMGWSSRRLGAPTIER